MCISPIRIRNPNLGLTGPNAQFKDCVSRFINVPCGVCHECVASRQMQMVQRLQVESLVNHLFFCTLTYNNDLLPKVSTSTGYDIRYADVTDVQKMFKRLRKRNAFGRPFRYLAVSELGSAKGRPHFHILWLIPKFDDDDKNTCLSLEKLMFDEVLSEWKKNFGARKFPDWKPLCTYVRKYVHGRLRSNFDLHYVNPILSNGGEADVAFYCLKYMMKPSNRLIRLQQALKLNLPDDEYENIWKIVRSRHFESEGFGLGTSDFIKQGSHRVYQVPDKVYEYLRSSIELSKKGNGIDDPMPSVFSPSDGSSRPLAKYYKSRGEVFNMQDFLDFFYSSKKVGSDNVIYQDEVDNQTDQAIDKFDKNVGISDFNQTANELDDLFDSDLNSQFLNF